MNLPNTLTLSRIFLTPLLVVVLLTRIDGKEIYGVVIFVIAALTDYLDGYIARKRNQVTDVGKLLDPIADKLLITSAFISLVELNLAPSWMVVIIVGREFAVSGIRSIAASQGYVMPANTLGKLKTVCQVLTIVVLIVADTYIEPWERFGRFLLWVTVAISLVSAVNYLWIFLRVGSSSRKLTNLRKEEIEYDGQREERKKVVS
ncbi:CDP-diacylglycerol--glycerol-3-phosphate 3-phosphatidyltransferase [bacterium]|nr:CDP-diacylglycerol--glycerol-3-phosphate 3-phosphatidyltransferase [bacterium]